MKRALALLVAGALLVAAACSSGDGRRDLLIVTVDTLRMDRLGAYGNPLGLTPHLDALAEESQVFTRAYSTASYTLPAVISLLTGRYPDEMGIRANVSMIHGTLPSLATRLWNQGWRTGAVVSNAILKEEIGLGVGFELYDHTLARREANRLVPERLAGETTDAAIAALEGFRAEGDAPIFLWVHYQDPHGPYVPPAGYRERFLGAERAAADGARRLELDETHVGDGGIPAYQRVGDARDAAFYRAGYDGEVQYVDEEIGRLLRAAREQRLMRDPVLVITADHGESMGEEDYWFAHGEYLSDAIVRIPLLIHGRGIAPARRDDVASLVDVLPTVSALIGAAPATDSRGRNLLAPDAPGGASRVLLTTGRSSTVAREGLVADGYRYVVSWQEGGPVERLYRIDAPAQDLAGDDPDRVAAMRRELVSVKQTYNAETEMVQALSPDELRELEALGYVTGDAAAGSDSAGSSGRTAGGMTSGRSSASTSAPSPPTR